MYEFNKLRQLCSRSAFGHRRPEQTFTKLGDRADALEAETRTLRATQGLSWWQRMIGGPDPAKLTEVCSPSSSIIRSDCHPILIPLCINTLTLTNGHFAHAFAELVFTGFNPTIALTSEETN